MQMICLTAHISHSILYQYNAPYKGAFCRSIMILHAAPDVTYQDIVKEFNSKNDDDLLETVTVLKDCRVVSMSVMGFRGIVTTMYERNFGREMTTGMRFYTFESAVTHFAKELIATREHEANGGHMNRGHKLKDYWPK